MRRALPILAGVLLAVPAAAAEDAGRALRLLTALDKTCVTTAAKPAALRKLVAPGQPLALPPLPDEQRDALLAGRKGWAWRLPPEIAGAALAMTEDGTCTIFVGAVDTEALVDLVAAYWEGHPQYRAEAAGSGDGPMRSHRFVLRPVGKGAPLKLTVLTAKDDKVLYRAALVVSR